METVEGAAAAVDLISSKVIPCEGCSLCSRAAGLILKRVVKEFLGVKVEFLELRFFPDKKRLKYLRSILYSCGSSWLRE